MEMESCYGEMKKRSFSYDIGDQKLKLIDISSEDDFLIDSPLFDSLEDLRLSVTLDDINENHEVSNLSKTSAEKDKSRQVNQTGRPSFLRRSSAWDNAFFTSAGLLDPHELSSVNKEFDTLQENLLPLILEDVRARRPDLQSVSNIETGSREMMNRGPVSTRKNISNTRTEKSKTERKRRECNSLDLKLPKMPRTRTSASICQSKISSPHMYTMDIGVKKRTGTGRDSMGSSSTAHSLYKTSMYAMKRGENEKSKLFASVSSTKTPIRSSSTKSKRIENLSSSVEIHPSYHKSPPSTTNSWSSKSSPSTSCTNRAHNDSNRRFNMTFGPTRNSWSPSQLTQPSGLCMPSPKFGFFDEDKAKSAGASSKVKRARSPLCTDSINRGLMKTGQIPSPRINPRYAASIHKTKNASYRASDGRKDGLDIHSKYQTDKSIEIDRKICSKLRKIGVGEHDRKRVGLAKENMATTIITPQFQTSQSRDKGITSTLSKSRNQESEVNDLSKYLELIDLNDETKTKLKQRKSYPHMRTPLVEIRDC